MEALLASHSQLKYRRDIDGLRAVAVLAVVGFHAFPEWFKGGFIGVDVFFVISGYLITSIIFKDLEAGDFSFSDFYSRRIKRIFPALLVVLLTSFIFGWFALLADEFKQLGKHILAGASFLSNIVLWNESSYFDNSADTKPLLHLWSLGVEEQFYIFWPLIIYIAWKRKFSLIKTITLSIIVSFLLNIVTINQDAVAAFYLPQTRFWELWAGSLIALIESHKANNCYPVFRKFGGLKSKKNNQFYILCWLNFVGIWLLANQQRNKLSRQMGISSSAWRYLDDQFWFQGLGQSSIVVQQSSGFFWADQFSAISLALAIIIICQNSRRRGTECCNADMFSCNLRCSFLDHL